MSTLPMATVLRFERNGPLKPTDELPQSEIVQGRYLVRFARTPAEIEAALRLRFEVFNLELGEGLASSFRTCRDEDEFDATSHHLLLIDRSRRRVIGTYRLRTYEIAKTIAGFYSSTEFDLGALPADIPEKGIEVGRTCIAHPYRNSQALLLLWKGLASYARHHQKQYFFGCCSMSSLNPTEGGRVFDLLQQEGRLHSEFRVNSRTGFKCLWYKTPVEGSAGIAVPQLLRTYLRMGARVAGPPALDRSFGTIDFFVVLDVNQMDRRMHCVLFGPTEEDHEFVRSA